jgi:hypothetical protein
LAYYSKKQKTTQATLKFPYNICMTPSVRIMFIDMNSFYASVEMQDNVGFRGKPTIVVPVVPVMSDNSCAIAASYQAKQLGNLKSSKDLIQPL